MIVDNQIRDLIAALEESSLSENQTNRILRKLITELGDICAKPRVQARYQALAKAPGVLRPYRIDSSGFAESFDPLVDEDAFFETWLELGVVVGRNVAPKGVLQHAIDRMRGLTLELSQGRCDLQLPSTYNHLPRDSLGVPLISRGFFELYHDDALAQIRQSVRLYIHHVVLWGTPSLWTSFDRLGAKLPGHEESYGLPLHVDQNPTVHPELKTTQGVLALVDCPCERGTFLAVPGSKSLFRSYSEFAGRGEYVELKLGTQLAEMLAERAQALPLRSGDFLSWDSRTTHANSANLSDKPRYVAYVSQGPIPHEASAARLERAKVFQSGEGTNVREALLHASKKPRYQGDKLFASLRAPEQLNLLGRTLYGIDDSAEG